MKSFRDLIKAEEIVVESPVGKVGRTTDAEALAHIEGSDLAKEFRKIVKKLGGKNVARQLLSGMNQRGDKIVVTEGKETIESYLRDAGYKIKSENPTKDGKEIEFYKSKEAESAFEDLKSAGFGKDFDIDLAHTIITYS